MCNYFHLLLFIGLLVLGSEMAPRAWLRLGKRDGDIVLTYLQDTR